MYVCVSVVHTYVLYTIYYTIRYIQTICNCHSLGLSPRGTSGPSSKSAGPVPTATVVKAASVQPPTPVANAVSASPPVPPAATNGIKKEFAEALYDNEVEDDEELAFKAGDRIEVLEKDDSGWYRGRLNGREGLFPVNYVKLV